MSNNNNNAQKIKDEESSTTSLISSHLIPRLVIEQQTSLTQDTVVKNGISNLVYVVVKQSIFTITLGLDTTKLLDGATMKEVTNADGRPILNFSQMTIEAKLFYDSDDENAKEREVVFVKSKPMEYKVRTNENGTQVSVDVRLQVLTSQMEDMLFRIKLRAMDPHLHTEIAQLTVLTRPIKVISKPEQSRKKKPVKKRTVNDMLFETLELVEKRQKKQFEILSKISNDLPSLMSSSSSSSSLPSLIGGNHSSNNINNNNNVISSQTFLSSSESLLPEGTSSSFSHLSSTLSSSGSLIPFYEEMHKRKKQKFEDDTPLDFEDAFRNLMDAFNNLQSDKKMERMKEFLMSSGTSNELAELHDLFSSEGLEMSIGRMFNSTPASEEYSECFCENCPHKIELERIEEFYKEIFSLP